MAEISKKCSSKSLKVQGDGFNVFFWRPIAVNIHYMWCKTEKAFPYLSGFKDGAVLQLLQNRNYYLIIIHLFVLC